MSTRKEPLANQVLSTTEEVLVPRYVQAVELLRALDQANAALKAFKLQLETDLKAEGEGSALSASTFLEFVKLRRGGALSSRLKKLGNLRLIASRFGEDDSGQGQLFDEGMSEKSRLDLALCDASEAGHAAGLLGVSTDGCPHEPGSELDAAWRTSHASARAFMRGTGQSSADETPAEVRPRRSSLREVA